MALMSLPAPPASLEELFARAREVARQLAQAEVCHVNEVKVDDLSAKMNLGEYVPWEATIYVDDRDVGRFLKEILKGRLKAADLERAFDAVSTLNHEHIHALGPRDHGDRHGYGILADGYAQRPVNRGPQNIEDAVTELWNELTIRRFIEETGLAALMPSLLNSNLVFADSYPAQCQSLGPVVDCFAQLTGLPRHEVLRMMAAEMPDTRSLRLASRVITNKGWEGREGNGQIAHALASTFDSFLDHKVMAEGVNHGYPATSMLLTQVRDFESER
jgi:hypothetical protein